MAWLSVLKAAAFFIFGGAVIGLIKGSVPIGALSGVMFLCVCLVIGVPVIAFDHLGRRSLWKPKTTSVPHLKNAMPPRSRARLQWPITRRADLFCGKAAERQKLEIEDGVVRRQYRRMQT